MLWQNLSCATCETNEPRESLIDMDVCTYRSLCYLIAATDLCENSTVHIAPIPMVPSRPDSISDRVCAGKCVQEAELHYSQAARADRKVRRWPQSQSRRATENELMSEKLSLIAFSHRKMKRK
ncbi:uncharacterized [Tachysurus ichikawai]